MYLHYMKYTVLQKHLQATKIKGQKYYVEYKPKYQRLWCYYDCKWPHYLHTPQLINSITRKYPECTVKLSRYDPILESHGMDPVTNDFVMIKKLETLI